ncbi:PREDICTED: histone H1oo-like [Chrysochloris asiatica]|uniref:Histone H1oo-like n=1 Tax=Chrysochloris asiatica TaxID=185453 RepID=A0A9B0WEA0_CHRAS|nr:PREDICTED: histone H1oo-like [Chrysochloris asiatica]
MATKKPNEVKDPKKPGKVKKPGKGTQERCGKPAVKGSSPGPFPVDAEAPKQTNSGSKSSKAKAIKDKNGATFPAKKKKKKKKAVVKVPKEATVLGLESSKKPKQHLHPRPRAPLCTWPGRWRPQELRRPGLLAKASLPKVFIKKAKIEMRARG